MTVIVFDLDDTLYDELTYVESGFRAVAAHIMDTYGIDSKQSFSWMWRRLQTYGRGHIFDDVLKHVGCYSKTAARKCLSIYRLHTPDISLDNEAEKCLQRLQNHPQYIVTDGNKVVQHRKLSALGLYDRMAFCYVTHRYGIKNAKPSPYCFLKIAEREHVPPDGVLYIGDNPRKDFFGIKKLGFQTVRVMQGQHKEVEAPKEYEAEFCISSLAELDESFLKMMAL